MLLTPAQAASRLHVTRATVLRLLRTGKLVGVRVGGQWRLPAYTVSALEVGVTPAKPSPETPPAA